MTILQSKIPEGPLAQKWANYKDHQRLVNSANKRKLDIIVVGAGLAGASASTSLGELGFNVKTFCYQDSPRRAHSIAAQGGINAAKNYQNDGDSIYRLFYDTIKGGDYRAREANVYRLAEVSNQIIDQCVAQGVPFAREYGGLLDTRSFGGAQVSRTFYARGQTGQQLLLGAYSALMRQTGSGNVQLFPRHEMLNLVIIDGKARGIITRNLVTGQIERHFAHTVVLASGGYGNAFFLSTNAMGSNGSAAWQVYKKGAFFANPSYVQIHPTCIPVHGNFQSKLTLMSESLRNDGRIWVPKKKEVAEAIRNGKLSPTQIAEAERDYYLERQYPAFGNLVPRDVASRAAKERCDAGYSVDSGLAVYLDFDEEAAKVVALKKEQENLQITMECSFVNELHIDQSISHNGVCLTVVSKNPTSYTVTAIKETLLKSNLGQLKTGDKVNLERSAKYDGRLDGHIVQGHVDQTAVCTEVKEADGSWYYTFEYSPLQDDYITVEKGSVSVNGVSLTVVNSQKNSFQVAIIPFTYEVTNFHQIKAGTVVNIEFDIIGKYIAKIIKQQLWK